MNFMFGVKARELSEEKRWGPINTYSTHTICGVKIISFFHGTLKARGKNHPHVLLIEDI